MELVQHGMSKAASRPHTTARSLCWGKIFWSQLESIWFDSVISPLGNDGMVPRETLPHGRRRKQLQRMQRTVRRKGFHSIITITIIIAFPIL